MALERNNTAYCRVWSQTCSLLFFQIKNQKNTTQIVFVSSQYTYLPTCSAMLHIPAIQLTNAIKHNTNTKVNAMPTIIKCKGRKR
jgi:hypothetical protein